MTSAISSVIAPPEKAVGPVARIASALLPLLLRCAVLERNSNRFYLVHPDARCGAVAKADSLFEATVLPEQLPQPILRNREGLVPVDAGHVLRRDQRVDNRFLGGVARAVKDGVDHFVGKHPNRRRLGSSAGLRIRRRKGDEEIAGAVSSGPAHAGDPEPRSTSDSFQLMREERRIGRDDD